MLTLRARSWVLFWLLGGSGFLATLASAQESEPAVFSGPQPGEALPALVMQPAWADDGAQLDLVQQAKGGPVALLFVHERTRPTLGLAMLVMKYCRQQESLTSGICILTADPTEAQTWLGRIRNYFPPGSQVGVSLEGPEGPGPWGLNRNVALTVVLAKDNRVTANFALVQPSAETDGQQILNAIAGLVGGQSPVDMAEYLPRQRGQQMAMRPDPQLERRLRALLNPQQSAEDRDRMLAELEAELKAQPEKIAALAPVAKQILDSGRADALDHELLKTRLKEWASQMPAPQRGGPDAKLTGLLRSLIQKTNTDAQVDDLAGQIESYAAQNEGARREIARITRTISDAGKLENYGTPHCQEILSRWAREFNSPAKDQ